MPFFVYVKVPLGPGQAARLPALHEDIERVLSTEAMGTLIGWGSSLSDAPDGRGVGAASHHRLDIEVVDQTGGLALLEDALARLAAPDGTELHYTHDGKALQKVYAGARWGATTPSTATSRHGRGSRR
ncbi:hypothetical protein [Roseateles sp.]|uniref:hypothetical protein n=1 Tax=Roseateles sp. TaxID=1971397 RepID=UPI0039E9B17C